ncbi:DgyrCDS1148 [Dimorphilus gyrociliatus]|uniref:XK-related protein n=1 Tax=Dimorphilus gyrociliatus TaxID=2664684 RepID=A0A7I8V6E8_9ANNE|nr:DgyrCDS1148 [Dimorphilus gyrociliatus]
MDDSMAGTENKVKRKLRFYSTENEKVTENIADSSQATFRYLIIFNGIIILFSTLTLIADHSTDIIVSIEYGIEGHFIWASLTLTFLLVPSVLVQIYSARCYSTTNENSKTDLVCILSHVFQIQPYERYWRLGVAFAKVKQEEDLNNCIRRQSDLSKIRLISACIGSGPQLTLQLFIILQTNDWTRVTVCSAIFSGVSLIWSIGSQWHCFRQENSTDYSFLLRRIIFVMVYQTGFLTSRILAIICLAFMLKAYVFAVLAIHGLFVFFWILLQKKDICPINVKEVFDKFVISLIHMFIFFNTKEGSTRLRMVVYYAITGAENFLFAIIWFLYDSPTPLNIALLSLTLSTFCIGVLLLLLFYRFCHPGGPIRCSYSSRKTLTIPPTPATPMPNSFQHYSIDTSACLDYAEPETKFNLTEMIMNGTTSCESNSFIFGNGWNEQECGRMISLTPKETSGDRLEDSYLGQRKVEHQ